MDGSDGASATHGALHVGPRMDLSLRRDENENIKAKARPWSPTRGAQGFGHRMDLSLRRDENEYDENEKNEV